MSLTAEDQDLLAALVSTYASYVDDRAFDAVADLFVTDGVLVLPDPPASLDPVREVIGRGAIQAELDRLRAFERTDHVALGQEFSARGAGAVGAITGEAHHVGDHRDVRRDLVWMLRYRDEYRRTDDGWRFVRREVAIDAIESRRLD